MGSSLSAQEQLFVQCDWAELIMRAMEASAAKVTKPEEETEEEEEVADTAEEADVVNKGQSLRNRLSGAAHRLSRHKKGGERGGGGNAKEGAKGDAFSMSSQEWQALMCLAEENRPTEAPSTILSVTKVSSHSTRDSSSSSSAVGSTNATMTITEPFIASLSHVACVAEGTIPIMVGVERIISLRHIASNNHLLYHQDTLLSVVLQLVQSVFVMQYNDQSCVPSFSSPRPTFSSSSFSPSASAPLPHDASVKEGTRKQGGVRQGIGFEEAMVVMEEAMRLRNALFKAFHAEERFGGYAKRPVFAFAMSLIGALCLAGSANAGLRVVAGEEPAQKESRERATTTADDKKIVDRKVSRGPNIGTLLDALYKVLFAALGELQALNKVMMKAGYRPREGDPSKSICGDFSIVRRLERSLQDKLLVVDLAKMRSCGVLKPPPSRPKTWSDLEQSYVGQRAIKSLIGKHFTARARGVVSDNKPTVLLFFGPSGHGKSELAKSIAKVLHPEEQDVEAGGKLVMIHLPSFCTKDSIYSLVDPPAAHVGEGMLLSALRREPTAVVVLDEFEKSTADSIQHLWLSAFQKDGMLRSLKDSARSTSTTKTTFILTCNLCDKVISDSEEEYLSATADEQERMRSEYVALCREAVRIQFGEPFLNRIDFFLPFVPYSVAEKGEFASLQLSAIASEQYRKHNRLFVTTPSYVQQIAACTRNFHTCSIAQQAQDILMEFPDSRGDVDDDESVVVEGVVPRGVTVRFAHSAPCVSTSGRADESLSTAVIQGAFLGSSEVVSMDAKTLASRVTEELGAHESHIVPPLIKGALLKYMTSLSLVQEGAVGQEAQSPTPSTPPPATPSVTSLSHSNTSIKGGDGLLCAQGSGASTCPNANASSSTPQPSPLLNDGAESTAASSHPEDVITATAAATATVERAYSGTCMGMNEHRSVSTSNKESPAATLRRRRGGATSEETEKLLLLETEMERRTEGLQTTLNREVLLEKEKEIQRLHEVITQKDKQISLLKETLKQMQKLVAILMIFSLSSVLLISVVLGLKVAFTFVFLCGLALYLLVDNFFSILWSAARAFFFFLGPMRSVLFLAAAVGYIAWSATYQSHAPCAKS